MKAVFFLRASWCGLMLVIVAAGSAWARERDNKWSHCPDSPVEASITACSALIASHTEKRADLALDFYYRGWAYLLSGREDFAIDDLSEAIRMHPGRMDGFFSFIRRTLHVSNRGRSKPRNFLAMAHALRGASFGHKGENDRAIMDYDQAIRLDGREAAFWADRGDAYRSSGRLDAALTNYDQAIHLNPQKANAFTGRALVFQDLGDRDRGKGDFDKALLEYDRAIADFSRALRIRPKNSYVLNNRGNAYVSKHEYDLGIADFNEALRIKPDATGTLQNRAIAFSDKFEYDLAIADLDEVIRLRPGDSDAFNTRGIQYGGKGLFEKALSDFEEAVRLDPNNALAIFNRGRAYDSLEQHDKAIADYSELVRRGFGGNAIREARVRNGLCWDRAIAGLLQQALDDCDHALAILPKDTRLNSIRANLLDSRGFTYLKMGQYERSIADYTAALQLNSSEAWSWYGRGLAKKMKGDAASAATDMSQAEFLDKDIQNKFKKFFDSAAIP